MKKRTVLGILGGWTLANLAVYHYRRELMAKWLGLSPATHDVAIDHKLTVTTPDGTKLATSHFSPRSAGMYPTIVVRTPYGRKSLFSRYLGERFAERGYHVIVQDTRGRFGSSGEFEPFTYEAADGHATLEWIKKQAWADDNIAMWGPSYLGYVQWAVAVDNPPELKAIVPCNTTSEFYTVSRQTFGFDGALRWLLITKVNSTSSFIKEMVAQFGTRKDEILLEKAAKHLPVSEADEIVVGKPIPFYRKWLEQGEATDPYWHNSDFSDKVSGVQAPAHFVSGWYDFMLRELLADYARLRAAGKNPYLTIGPWGHLSLGGLGEQIRQGNIWFEAQMKGDHTRLRQNAVRYFVTGAKEWRETPSWPPPAQTQTRFLHSQLRLDVAPPEPESPPDHYRYDPSNPTPSVGGAIFSTKAGPADNRAIEARPDVLCYTSAPLTGKLEIVGPVCLQLYVKSNLEHTDFFGRLCDVWPNGRSLNVCDGIVRLRPDDGKRQPDGSLCLDIDFAAVAHRFLPGHQLRLQVASAAHPRWNRNLGTGDSLVTATAMLTAEQTIFHDAAHPSALSLPIVSP